MHDDILKSFDAIIHTCPIFKAGHLNQWIYGMGEWSQSTEIYGM